MMKAALGLLAAATLILFSACKPGPATITGSVSFMNPASSYRTFPPAGHSGNLSDDVAYIRLLDDDGAGDVIWESSAIPAGEALSPYAGKPTPDEGVYIGNYVINFTDAEVAALSMPLRLEAFLYDAPVTGNFPALNPATDTGRYTCYDANWEGDSRWFYSVSFQASEVKTASLIVTLPFPQP